MESQANTQQNPGNAQVISNQNPPGPGTIHNNATLHLFFVLSMYFLLKKSNHMQNIG
jgi:PAX-interacting protein 1